MSVSHTLLPRELQSSWFKAGCQLSLGGPGSGTGSCSAGARRPPGGGGDSEFKLNCQCQAVSSKASAIPFDFGKMLPLEAFKASKSILDACLAASSGLQGAGTATAAATQAVASLKTAFKSVGRGRPPLAAAGVGAAGAAPLEFPCTAALISALTLATCGISASPGYDDFACAAGALLLDIVDAPHLSAQVEAILSR